MGKDERALLRLMRWVGSTQFLPFQEADYAAYSGLESDDPLIGYITVQEEGEYGTYTIVIDGPNIIVRDSTGGETQFCVHYKVTY